MDFRLAVMQDLPQIQAMYSDIVRPMAENGIDIWDEIYPCAFFEEDIRRGRLYGLWSEGELMSAFALCERNSGEASIRWKHDGGMALYLDRFGVNARYLRRGIGSLMLERAKQAAKEAGAAYLRLFVVDINEPAIRLYARNGFVKADGIYDEAVDGGLVLREYGFETAL